MKLQERMYTVKELIDVTKFYESLGGDRREPCFGSPLSGQNCCCTPSNLETKVDEKIITLIPVTDPETGETHYVPDKS